MSKKHWWLLVGEILLLSAGLFIGWFFTTVHYSEKIPTPPVTTIIFESTISDSEGVSMPVTFTVERDRVNDLILGHNWFLMRPVEVE